MKRLASSESLGALFSNRQEEKASLGLHSILDGLEEDDCLEESGHMSEKKRRLSVEQVKALEKNFEVENKLEPDRKVKLAQELSLQPRQVAVWFQNRRARWKTKQLEKDYTLLKANYESLKLNFNALQHDKEALLAELSDLKSKLQDKNTESKAYIKEEPIQETHETDAQVSESEYKPSFQGKIQTFNNEESDSSAVLDNSSPQDAISPDGPLPQMVMMISPIISSSLSLDSGGSSVSNSSVNCLEFTEADHVSANAHKGYHQFMRTEEHNFLNSPEESCNFFSDEQAPSLMWYCGEPWN